MQRIREVFTDPQAIESQYAIDFNHPALGKVKIPGHPIHLGSARTETQCAAPALGERKHRHDANGFYGLGRFRTQKMKE